MTYSIPNQSWSLEFPNPGKISGETSWQILSTSDIQERFMLLVLKEERFSDTRFIAQSQNCPETPDWLLSSHLRVSFTICSLNVARKGHVGLLLSPLAFENSGPREKYSNEKSSKQAKGSASALSAPIAWALRILLTGYTPRSL